MRLKVVYWHLDEITVALKRPNGWRFEVVTYHAGPGCNRRCMIDGKVYEVGGSEAYPI